MKFHRYFFLLSLNVNLSHIICTCPPLSNYSYCTSQKKLPQNSDETSVLNLRAVLRPASGKGDQRREGHGYESAAHTGTALLFQLLPLVGSPSPCQST